MYRPIYIENAMTGSTCTCTCIPCPPCFIAITIKFHFDFRPSADEVLHHCLFWSKSRQMSFFQDVSDRIEKETPQSSVVQSLERGAIHVIKGDWRDHIGEELRQGITYIHACICNAVGLLHMCTCNRPCNC